MGLLTDDLLIDDPVWPDAYLIGGAMRVVQTAIASLLHGRFIDLSAHEDWVRGPHTDLADGAVLQRLVLTLIASGKGPRALDILRFVRTSPPVCEIEEDLVAEGLLGIDHHLVVRRVGPTEAGLDRRIRLAARPPATLGPRGVAYLGPHVMINPCTGHVWEYAAPSAS